VFTRADEQIIIAPRILRQAANIAIGAVAVRDWRNFRFGHQRLQPLLGGRIAVVIQLIHIQRTFERDNIAGRFCASAFSLLPIKLGTTILASTPRITMTTINSSVKPAWRARFFFKAMI
jgi:hypothetical protein